MLPLIVIGVSAAAAVLLSKKRDSAAPNTMTNQGESNSLNQQQTPKSVSLGVYSGNPLTDIVQNAKNSVTIYKGIGQNTIDAGKALLLHGDVKTAVSEVKENVKLVGAKVTDAFKLGVNNAKTALKLFGL